MFSNVNVTKCCHQKIHMFFQTRFRPGLPAGGAYDALYGSLRRTPETSQSTGRRRLDLGAYGVLVLGPLQEKRLRLCYVSLKFRRFVFRDYVIDVSDAS